MIDQWKQLKETITELRDNKGVGTQQEVCRFLVNLMDNLEKEYKTGKWEIKYSKNGVIFPICSNCDYAATNWVETKYCPNCGAEMENGE